MTTVGRLARKHGLSRSTLLYYDRIGLLKPSGHMKGEYRTYSRADEERLERIVTFRRAGLSLKEIARVLDAQESRLGQALEERLEALSGEIRTLQEQQRFILTLLGAGELPADGVLDKATWTGLLAQAGFSEQDMRNWHAQFEARSPEAHLRFLQLLCIPKDEIEIIRSWAAGPQRMVRIKEMSEKYMKYLYKLFEPMPRKGPGSSQATLLALNIAKRNDPGLPAEPRVLDVGCGNGPHSLALAGQGARVTCVDNHQPFLDDLADKARQQGVAGRITPVLGDMRSVGKDLGVKPGDFDLLWSEGALYIMGFDQGLAAMRELVEPGRCFCVSECVWLRPDPPGELADYWNQGYPAMLDVPANLERARRCGWEPVDHFLIERRDWEDFYGALERMLPAFREEHDADEARMVADEMEREIRLYRDWPDWWGYLFMVLKKVQ